MDRRIGIIAANNIKYSPYIYFYSKVFDEIGIPYDVIYPNRNELEEKWIGENCNTYQIKWNKRLHSIINYKCFTDKVVQIIKKNDYAKLVILTGVNAAYMASWLSKNYPKRYIVDIRDFSLENIRVFSMYEKKALEAAEYRVLSSPEFEKFLPKMKYHIAHNISFPDDSMKTPWTKHSAPITIGYVGTAGYFVNVKALIRLVKDDSRFVFHIFGSGPDEVKIRNEVASANCERIRYFGSYDPEKKSQIIEKVDILFNVYGNDSPLLLYALSNKLYDSMYYHKLILNSCGTYMEKLSGVSGFSVDLSDSSSLDRLYDWYESLDEKTINNYQQLMLESFRRENNQTKDILKRFARED